MMKKLFKAFILQLLILEIRIRGTRIKPSTWRLKLKKLFPEYKVVPPITLRHVQFVANDRKKVAYIRMHKASSTSLIRTLLESERFRDEIDRYALSLYPKQKKSAAKQKTVVDMMYFLKNKGKRRPPPFIYGERFFPEDMSYIFYLSKKNKLVWKSASCNKKEGCSKKIITLSDINSNFIFTFVRNPYSRLVSLFNYKFYYKNSKYHYRDAPALFSVREVSSFNELAAKIHMIPDCYLEIHSWPQYIRVEYFKSLGGKIDFIGKYENLEEDFEKLRRRFDLLPLEHLNKSSGEKKDWRDYYTPKTAKLVYKRYRKDFEMFGYEDEYPKLLDYLKFRSKREA